MRTSIYRRSHLDLYSLNLTAYWEGSSKGFVRKLTTTAAFDAPGTMESLTSVMQG